MSDKQPQKINTPLIIFAVILSCVLCVALYFIPEIASLVFSDQTFDIEFSWPFFLALIATLLIVPGLIVALIVLPILRKNK